MLENYIKQAKDFVKSEFDLELNQSQVKIYSRDYWNLFCEVNNFNSNCESLYVPVSFCAYVIQDSKFLIPNIFNELFGRGLFVEHSKINYEKSKLYNGFALYLESKLCKKTNNENIFEKKKESFSKANLDLLDFVFAKEKELQKKDFLNYFGFNI